VLASKMAQYGNYSSYTLRACPSPLSLQLPRLLRRAAGNNHREEIRVPDTAATACFRSYPLRLKVTPSRSDSVGDMVWQMLGDFFHALTSRVTVPLVRLLRDRQHRASGVLSSSQITPTRAVADRSTWVPSRTAGYLILTGGLFSSRPEYTHIAHCPCRFPPAPGLVSVEISCPCCTFAPRMTLCKWAFSNLLQVVCALCRP